ncbi:hypothetical protein ACP275_14G263700 [Erythranthe tilingii]
MGSFSGLGIGLSFVFGCILMGLVGELYYLLWWKKRIIANTTTTSSSREIDDFSFHFCWRNPSSFRSTAQLTNSVRNSQQDLEMGCSDKDSEFRGYNSNCEEDLGVETELMRIHNRFLFTIKEESREDLESEDGKKSRKGSRTRSLSDLVYGVDGGNGNGTPFLTPLSSPIKTLDSYNNHGFNPLFETLTEAELNKLRSSPPPKFKFLKDAEDKLLKRMLEEAEAGRKKGLKNDKIAPRDEESASFVSVLREQLHNQATQVLPLASSPTFRHGA